MSEPRRPFLVRSDDGYAVQILPCVAGGWLACLRPSRYFPADEGEEEARQAAARYVASVRLAPSSH